MLECLPAGRERELCRAGEVGPISRALRLAEAQGPLAQASSLKQARECPLSNLRRRSPVPTTTLTPMLPRAAPHTALPSADQLRGNTQLTISTGQ